MKNFSPLMFIAFLPCLTHRLMYPVDLPRNLHASASQSNSRTPSPNFWISVVCLRLLANPVLNACLMLSAREIHSRFSAELFKGFPSIWLIVNPSEYPSHHVSPTSLDTSHVRSLPSFQRETLASMRPFEFLHFFCFNVLCFQWRIPCLSVWVVLSSHVLIFPKVEA